MSSRLENFELWPAFILQQVKRLMGVYRWWGEPVPS